MSDPNEMKTVGQQPLYILLVLFAGLLIAILDAAIPTGLYCLIYGVPSTEGWFTVAVNEYSHATLWKDRIWFEKLKLGSGKGTLTSFDPDKGDSTESSLTAPSPSLGLLPQGDRLWVISANSVTQIENNAAVEVKPQRLLGQVSDPFLYGDQVAVIDLAARPQPVLLVLKNGQWDELGAVQVPGHFASSYAPDGKRVLITVPTGRTAGPFLSDVKVIPIQGQLHVFVSDGSNVIHRTNLDFATASALAPANVDEAVDLNDMSQWEYVCPTSRLVGAGNRSGWVVGVLNGEPVVVTTSSAPTTPFQNTSLITYREKNGTWEKSAEQSSPGLMNLFAVSDGRKSYVGGSSFAQTVRIHELLDNQLRPTGTVLKAPVMGFQEPLQRWIILFHCVFWPSLVILALILSRLMSTHLPSTYEFGLTTVTLASVTRRILARLIDLIIYAAGNFLIVRSFGLTSQEDVAKNMDKFFDNGPQGMMSYIALILLIVFGWMMLYLLIISIFQARWGVTLGNWICGIRTVRTTLRPCGFFRAFFRELLMILDIIFSGLSMFLISLILALNTNRQRLADMVADTIVIRKPKTTPTEKS